MIDWTEFRDIFLPIVDETSSLTSTIRQWFTIFDRDDRDQLTNIE
jgi:hypothetical protein